ncbi:hypothetical protein [Microbulbifer spongiae]|uniref:Uncharacterized protein n=1 Tax=Microbulbifer spongiae TaxID=2944933 RepID=A0ABY9EBX2_9GAMM|nr:hypothetical protein [Microbulbifer sp. MI-G]WKD49456.1 hypothetical protein M8T91_16410 [Microbulbifer sp. MI-G]
MEENFRLGAGLAIDPNQFQATSGPCITIRSTASQGIAITDGCYPSLAFSISESGTMDFFGPGPSSWQISVKIASAVCLLVGFFDGLFFLQAKPTDTIFSTLKGITLMRLFCIVSENHIRRIAPLNE